MEGDSGPGIRNIGVFAHVDAGKTTLTERFLFASGRVREPGTVDGGSTETDYLDVERRRGITVKAAATFFSWRDIGINLIDTPGHVDFSFEAERSIRALDGAIMVVCGVSGVQSQLERVWRECSRRGIPRLVFVNKLDRSGASFDSALEDLGRLSGEAFAPLRVPVVAGGAFLGALDVLSGGFEPADGGPELGAAEAGYGLALEEARAALREAVAAVDEEELEAYGTGRPFDPVALGRAIRRACLSRSLVPVIAGSAITGLSVPATLDAIADFLPSPADALPVTAWDPEGASVAIPSDATLPLSAFVFGCGFDSAGQPLAYVRMRSGRLERNDVVLRTVRGSAAFERARVKGLYRVHAGAFHQVAGAKAGDLVAVAGIPGLAPGDSLSAPERPVAFERFDAPESLVSLAVEPRSRAEADAVRGGLLALCAMDPSLRAEENRDTGQFVLSGVGELQLEVAFERLSKEYGVKARRGEPMVAFRETASGRVRVAGEVDFDLNGRGIHARVALEVAPAARGAGISFDGSGATEWVAEATRRGVEAAAGAGPAYGCRVVDVEVRLVSAEGDVRPESYEAAAARAFRKALEKASLLEPYGRFELDVPAEHLGSVVSAVAIRQGRVESVEDDGGFGRIVALMPMRTSFGFASEIRSVSGGRASLQARFSGYEPAPKSVVP